jgi:hypothetical protein
MFARIRVAFVSHVAGIEHHLAFATILFFLPIGRQSIVTVDSDQLHAANETVLGLTTADKIVRSSGNRQQSGKSKKREFNNHKEFILPKIISPILFLPNAILLISFLVANSIILI